MLLFFICLEINSQNFTSDFKALQKYNSMLEYSNNVRLKKFEEKNNIKWLSILPSINYDLISFQGCI